MFPPIRPELGNALLDPCTQVKDSTGEDTREGVTVTSTHEEELPGSKGSANFALKWVRDSKHVAYLNVKEIEKELKNKSKQKITGCYTANDDGNFVGLVAFECRGLDVIGWQPEVSSSQVIEASKSVHGHTWFSELRPNHWCDDLPRRMAS